MDNYSITKMNELVIHAATLMNLKCIRLSVGFPGISAGKESACNAGDLNLIPGLGRSPGKGNS